jgi:hypothetical protein
LRTLAIDAAEARFLGDRFSIESLVEGENATTPAELLVWRNDTAGDDYELEERIVSGRTAATWAFLRTHPTPTALEEKLAEFGYDEESVKALVFALSSTGLVSR